MVGMERAIPAAKAVGFAGFAYSAAQIGVNFSNNNLAAASFHGADLAVGYLLSASGAGILFTVAYDAAGGSKGLTRLAYSYACTK